MDLREVFRASTRLVAEPLLLVQRDGGVAEVNDAAVELFGVPRGRLRGARLGELFANPTDSLAAYLRLCSGSTDPLPGSLAFVRDGRTEIHRCAAALFSADHPDLLVVKLFAVNEEAGFAILGRTLADLNDEVQQRRRTERQLQVVIDSIPVLVAYVDADTRYRFVNRAYEGWFGIDRRALIGKPLVEVLGPAAFERTRVHVEAALRGERVEYEARVPYQHGPTRDVRGVLVPHTNVDGRVEGYVALITDVTKEKRAAEAAAFLSDATAVLFSSLDYETTLHAVARMAVPRFADWCAVYLLDEKHGTSLQSVAVAHVDPERVSYATALRERYPPDLNAQSGVAKVLRTGESELVPVIPDEMLVSIARDDEHLRLIRGLGLRSWMCVPLRAGAETIGALVLVLESDEHPYDADDLAQAEEVGRRAAIAVQNARLYRAAKEAIAKRDDFLAVASHELKTPLTSIELYVSGLLRAIERPDRSEKFVAAVERGVRKFDGQVQRLKMLIAQLLDVARLSQGRLPLEVDELDLAALVEEVVARFEEDSGRTETEIHVEIASRPVGRWDRNRVDQVVTNLVANAIKYGAGKPVVVRVEGDHDAARLVVKDHGIGISAADHARIFERFERAASARNYGGLGLGLWIVREIVRAHGGRATVESTPDHGATFTVELPLSALLAQQHPETLPRASAQDPDR